MPAGARIVEGQGRTGALEARRVCAERGTAGMGRRHACAFPAGAEVPTSKFLAGVAGRSRWSAHRVSSSRWLYSLYAGMSGARPVELLRGQRRDDLGAVGEDAHPAVQQEPPEAPEEYKALSYKAYLMCFGSTGMFRAGRR